ncbi:EAL domain-containing protein [Noviherbaspirillum autotrophicum]|uniref:EAL domain-containing protein n=1 Tax=Noviherbaspirillum autotrophicum TaxID=709839 RepID=UPI0018DF4123|nr:EAL domain-containing protein [Noviherbaspirillum autotrophicum]
MSLPDSFKYAHLVDVEKLQSLMESFHQVIGIANAVIDVDGVVIAHAGWQEACVNFHRVDARTCQRCNESDTSLAESMTRGLPFAIYRCLNGLLDTAAPIIVDGQHVANVFTGQFLTDAPDLDFFRKQARQFGFDEARYLDAISKVPVLPRERVESVIQLYATLAGMLADSGLNRLRQTQSAQQLAAINRDLEDTVGARTTALARTNAELAAREAMLTQILDTSSVAIFLVDMDGRITHANRRMAEMFATPLDALVGNEYVALVHPAERDMARQRMLDLLCSNTASVELERLYYRPDQTTFWGTLTGKRFYDISGVITGLVGVIADITDRKHAEIDLRIAAIAFEAQEGMFITDAQGVILRVNRAFSEITGYSSAEAIGQTPQPLRSTIDNSAFYTAVKDSILQTGTWQGDIWHRRKNGEKYPLWLTITAVYNASHVLTHFVGTMTDMTSRKEAEDAIRNLAFYDPLTHLPNRRLLLDRLKQALATCTRTHRNGALLFIDLDNFKMLNDTLGHDVGDQLLQQVAQRLIHGARQGDTVARLGGDEFVVMLENLSDCSGEAATQAEIVGEHILGAFSQAFQLQDGAYPSTASIGVTLFSDHQGSIEDLLKQADLAMYQAKAAGRNTLRFFNPEMQAAIAQRAALESDLRLAVQESQFALYYQVQVGRSGEVTGAEALVRWLHPARGLIAPGEFIPLAEETGLIQHIGTWVLQTACEQLSIWAAHASTAHLTLAVNVSARQFRRPDFVEQVLSVIEKSGANPQRLKLELTESLLVDDVEGVITKMCALKAKGVSFSLDDFGTGYSSLAYLKRLPLDQLKIDRSFVRDILIDGNDAAIARTIVALADSMNLSVIAEGVETHEQRDALSATGCYFYQGYLFGRPLPLPEFEQYVRERPGYPNSRDRIGPGHGS